MAGFLALRNQGEDYTGLLETYSVDAAHASLLAPGDVVVITGEADAEGRAEVDAAAAGAAFTGVIAAVEPIYEGENLTETGLPASTAGKVHCHIDRNQIFEVDVVNGPLTVSQVGLNADIDATAATKSGGLTVSNMALNAATAAATATLQFRIVGIKADEAGTLGNVALVRPNNTTLATASAGV